MTTQGDRRRPPHSQGALLMHITSEEHRGAGRDREQQSEGGRGKPKLEPIDPATGRRRGVRSSRQLTDRAHRPALPTVFRRFICRAGSGRTGEHQERTAGAVRKLLGGASVDQASDRAIAARANDQQIERRAVQRQLLAAG